MLGISDLLKVKTLSFISCAKLSISAVSEAWNKILMSGRSFTGSTTPRPPKLFQSSFFEGAERVACAEHNHGQFRSFGHVLTDRAVIGDAGIVEYAAVHTRVFYFLAACVAVDGLKIMAGEEGRRGAAGEDGIVKRDIRRGVKRTACFYIFKPDRVAAMIDEIVLRVYGGIVIFASFFDDLQGITVKIVDRDDQAAQYAGEFCVAIHFSE